MWGRVTGPQCSQLLFLGWGLLGGRERFGIDFSHTDLEQISSNRELRQEGEGTVALPFQGETMF